MDVDVYEDSSMNVICLGCGDDMFANEMICEVCWNGDL